MCVCVCVCVHLQLLKVEEDASYKPARKACVQLVDNLVEHILKYEESLAGAVPSYHPFITPVPFFFCDVSLRRVLTLNEQC